MLQEYNYWGMHLVWWFIWGMLLLWIFAIPYGIPGERTMRETPLDILLRRFASGEIKTDEYQEKRRLIENKLGQQY